MPVRIEPNAEPIPGYKLIERLGGGGFGEVWKAEAPGGLQKAIKFVFGDLHAAEDADGARATQELKALSRVKTVHHPYILSLERYDIIEGQLIIVMELADRTLWDRFKECRSQGLPGIPRAELLLYMHETAEALDLMNSQYQLQHLDIKPQNLFLVFNHVKVADFGLVKDLGNMAAATVTGGVTPVYAAPETFDGWLSRFSDQYSLAIVYQELLTGQRPFTGSTMRRLVLQHLQGDPDVSPLPARDRPVVQRALAKNPDNRFASCLDFVEALEAAGVARPGAVPEAVPLPPTPADAPTAPPVEAPSPASALTEHSRGQPSDAEPQVVEPPVSELADTEQPVELEVKAVERANVLPPRPTGAVDDTPLLDEPCSVTTRSHRGQAQAADLKPSAAESTFRGIVQPSLIVGLGKLGLQTLLTLRRTLTQAFGHPDALPHVRLMGIDTDPKMIQSAGHGDSLVHLRPHEMVLARLHRPGHYLQQRTRDGDLPTDTWLNSKFIYQLPRWQTTARLRALGRLAFVDNYRHIAKRLEAELQACAAQDTLKELVEQTDLGIRSPIPRVYVIAGLGGNTGSGMFLDTAYTLRHLLRKHGFGRAEVVGLFFLPAMAHEGIRSDALAHGFAALTELHHYASGQSVFKATYPDANPSNPAQSICEAGAPFERCFLMTLPAQAGASQPGPSPMPETAVLAAQFLYRDVVTSLGKTVDAVRQQWQLTAPSLPCAARTYQTFGLFRIVRPRQRVVEQAARRLCRRLVVHWMNKNAAAVAGTVAQWAPEQWDAVGLRPESLIAKHQELCARQLKQTPERLLLDVLNPLVPVLAPPGGAKPDGPPINFAPVVSALAELEKLFGLPEECRSGSYTPGTVESALDDVAGSLADALDHQLTTHIVRLLEEPAFRLAGAEEGLRQFSQITEKSLETQETLTKELHDRAATLYTRIQKLLESPQPVSITPTKSTWKFGLPKKSLGGPMNFGSDLLELLRAYAKTRYQSLVLRHINRLYVGLRGHLSDQIREVGFCRQRLSELAGLLEPKVPLSAGPNASFEKMLLPPDCGTIAEVVERIDARLTPDDLLAFDKIIQPIIRQQYRALLHVCMGPSNLVRTLAPVMIQEAEQFLAERLQKEADTALALLDPEDPACSDILTAAFDDAAPECGKLSAEKEITVAAFPTTPAGQRLKELAQRLLPDVHLIDVDDGDEVTFYRELQQVTLQELEQYGSIAQEAYRQKCANDPGLLHTRTDVSRWQSAAL